jgi:hypothetical protein
MLELQIQVEFTPIVGFKPLVLYFSCWSGTNDIGSVYNVTGITAKAEKIAYRLESVYLTASSNCKC